MKLLLLSFFLMMLYAYTSFAQRPTHVPGAGEPARVFESPVNVVIYIVIPLLIGVFYLLWRRKIKKENKQNQKQK